MVTVGERIFSDEFLTRIELTVVDGFVAWAETWRMSMKTSSAIACLLFVSLPMQLWGIAAQNLVDYQTIYAQETTKIKNCQSDLEKVERTYLTALDDLESAYKKAGDFPGTKAVRQERERFSSERIVLPVTPEGTPEGISKAQTIYRSTVSELTADRNARLLALTQRYSKALRKYNAMLLEQNKMDEAEIVNQEIEKAIALELSLKPSLDVHAVEIEKVKEKETSNWGRLFGSTLPKEFSYQNGQYLSFANSSAPGFVAGPEIFSIHGTIDMRKKTLTAEWDHGTGVNALVDAPVKTTPTGWKAQGMSRNRHLVLIEMYQTSLRLEWGNRLEGMGQNFLRIQWPSSK